MLTELPSSNTSNSTSNINNNNNNLYQINGICLRSEQRRNVALMTISKIKISSNKYTTILYVSPRAVLAAGNSFRIACTMETCILTPRPPSTWLVKTTLPPSLIQSLQQRTRSLLARNGCAGNHVLDHNPLHTLPVPAARRAIVALIIEGGHGRQCIMRDEDW
jgi:hypothetical protein